MDSLKVIAKIKSDFPAKFGIPRQSGLVAALKSIIVFEPEYRNPDALRGLEDFSHLWLIWGFSEAERAGWSPTVRPPRLGGNTRLGVFATRSPYRPNSLGLSSLEIVKIETDPKLGPLIHVCGADLLDDTPIYDIKPYLPFTDCHPEARAGFVQNGPIPKLHVKLPEPLLALVPPAKRAALLDILALDPRPAYHDDPRRVYGMSFAGLEIRFRVSQGVLTVVEVE